MCFTARLRGKVRAAPVRWENSLGAGEQIPRVGKAAVINVLLLRAHQCHLWVERGFQESLCVSAVDVCFWRGEKRGAGDCGPDPGFVRGCDSLDVAYCHLSPTSEGSDSARLVETKSDSETARGKSKEPRRGQWGEDAQGGFLMPGEGGLGWGCRQARQSLTCCSVACCLAEPGA